jgi:formylglycine-generating enzyme required for sulfatase activity
MSSSLSSSIITLFLIATLSAAAQPTASPSESFKNSVGMTMNPIPAGSFQMGQAEREKSYKSPWSPEKDTGADWDESPVRQVKISHSFFMGATEVTNAQYEQFDPQHRKLRPRGKESADDDAVVNVNWDDANAFCQWISQKEGKSYRLPTEAEWEYACRAGTKTLFNTGDTLPDGYQPAGQVEGFSQFFPSANSVATNKIDVANQNASSSSSPAAPVLPSYYRMTKKASLEVGRGPANAWGLYGMHGNAEEWCLDWYASYDPAQTVDPVGPVDGEFRVVRGGANWQLARLLRSANRLSMEPWVRNSIIGFRVVQAEAPPPPTATALPVMPSSNPPAPALKNEKVDLAKPFFAGPARYVNIPPGSEGPLFSTHNHDPAITVFPNGDVFILHYTCDTEFGHELAVAATRLPVGASAFTPPVLFYQCADANNHAPALFVDRQGTIFHFNGNRAMPGSIVRTSIDNGQTWSHARPLNDDFQPSEANIQTKDGRILETCDSRFDNAGTVTMSADNGRTWTKLSDETIRPVYESGKTGPCIAGIHVGLIERKDGTLWALGRIDRQNIAALFDHKLPTSTSTDGGKTWTYGVSEFPGITSGQRLTLKRLKEGPLLLCTFTDDLAHRDAAGKVTGAKKPDELNGMTFRQPDGTMTTGYGLFAALSYDDGVTWPVRRLVTPRGPGETELRAQSTDGGSISLDATHAELNGYLASCQGADNRIHLISSRNYYVFDLAWLEEVK